MFRKSNNFSVNLFILFVILCNTSFGFCQNTEHRVSPAISNYKPTSRQSWKDLHDYDSPKDQLAWDTILSNERKHSPASPQKESSSLNIPKVQPPMDTLINPFYDYPKKPQSISATSRRMNKKRKNNYRGHKKYKHFRIQKYNDRYSREKINWNADDNGIIDRIERDFRRSRTRGNNNKIERLKINDDIIVKSMNYSKNNNNNNNKIFNFTKLINDKKIERNVEKVLTKNLENEIMKMRLDRPFSLINSDEKVGDDFLPRKNEISDVSSETLSRKINITKNKEKNNANEINPSESLITYDSKNSTRNKSVSEKKLLDHRIHNLELLGDLSCMNGTFVPAPYIPNGVIKYVKSSKPEHEYLEADYECTSGFKLSKKKNTRLLCKNREWIGEKPLCIKKTDELCLHVKCDHMCTLINDTAKCSCYKGFSSAGNKCIDVDECEEENGNCQYTCINTIGSYRCECPRGMKYGEDKFTCIDVNECDENNGRGPCQDLCRNTEGSYICSCERLPGTILSSDNHTCLVTGHCNDNNAGCSHTCLSTAGRIFCLCPEGFVLQDDWKTCQDVDECAVSELQTEVCRYGCINTPGSYRCADPLEFKDQSTIEKWRNDCPSGYEPSSLFSCLDIDECADNNGGCTEVCENTQGSYFCACNGDEKVLSSDGKSCIEINAVSCPPLNPVKRGTLICSRQDDDNTWQPYRAVNRPGTKCYLKCPRNYQLLGEYQITCYGDGKWKGQQNGECVKYVKPRLECPEDVIAELPPGRNEAFVKFNQPSTDLDWFRYVKSKPSWGTRLEANLQSGLHIVTFIAKHPVSKKQVSCSFRIVVKDGEAPKVHNCPKDIAGKNGSIIVWDEPVFTDNVRVTHVTNNQLIGGTQVISFGYSEITVDFGMQTMWFKHQAKGPKMLYSLSCSQSPEKTFDIGQWKITYNASDDAGWSTLCSFNVSIR